MVAATGGIALLYFLSFILGFFGVSVPLVHSSGTFGILFSVFVVVIAALNLVLNFDFIEKGAERGAPKYMEWYGAFGLAGDAGLAVSGDPAPSGQATVATAMSLEHRASSFAPSGTQNRARQGCSVDSRAPPVDGLP